VGEELLKEEDKKEESGLPSRIVFKRLVKKEAVTRVFQEGSKHVSTVLVLFCLRNNSNAVRMAIHARKKLGIAVERNRIKRIFKESIRSLKSNVSGYDFIIVPRSGAIGLHFRQVTDHLIDLFSRVGIIKR